MAPSAKKKALRRAAMSEPALCDGSESNMSGATSAISLSDWGIEATSETDLTPLEAAVELLYEKRGSTRERGLEALASLLACSYACDEVSSKRETLSSLAINCVRRGGAMEAALAARVLGLLTITLGAGDESDRLFQDAEATLLKAVKPGKASSVRTTAVEVLALMAFVDGDVVNTADVMHALEDLRSAAPPVAAAAIRGWSLLLTTIPQSRLGGANGSTVETRLAGLGRALDAEDVAVRQAAGEGAALLYSQSGLAADRDSPSDSGPASPTAEPQLNGAAPNTGAAEMDDVVLRMRQLAAHRGDAQRRSKRDRSALKTTFRELISTVEDGTVQEARVKLPHGDVLTVDSLAGLVQLNAFRRFLAEGFQAHLQANPLLHEVFDFQPSAQPAGAELADQGYSRGEIRRMMHSPNSASAKAATQRRSTARADSAMRKGASYSNFEEGVW